MNARERALRKARWIRMFQEKGTLYGYNGYMSLMYQINGKLDEPESIDHQEYHHGDGSEFCMTYKEIALVMGCSPENIRQIVDHALIKLRKTLNRWSLDDRYYWEEDRIRTYSRKGWPVTSK